MAEETKTIEIKVGRPLKFSDPKELSDKIDAYFNSCFKEVWEDEDVRDELGNRSYNPDTKQYLTRPVKVKKQICPITVGGLAVFLDTSRETLREYKERAEFVDTIKRAWDFIEMQLENGMLSGTLNVTASIFNAKNNFGWKDNRGTDLTTKGDKINQTIEVTFADFEDDEEQEDENNNQANDPAKV